ncbi:MAG: DUF4824 family protein [Campylobacterota bacterium]
MIRSLLSSKGLFVIAFLLIVITNAVVLFGVQANRSSELTSQITLSERELQLPYGFNRENNGITLRMDYRVFNNDVNNTYSYYNNPAWLNSEKLTALGFEVDKYVDVKYPKPAIPKEVLLVLENDGEAYKNSLQRVKERLLKERALFDDNPTDRRVKSSYEMAEKELQRESKFASRLFVIDAGLEYGHLREQYSDMSRYLIVKGIVQLVSNESKKRVYGYVQELSIRSIYMPLEHKSIFQKLEHAYEVEPRYSVTLHYGSRYEPWVASVDALSAQ